MLTISTDLWRRVSHVVFDENITESLRSAHLLLNLAKLGIHADKSNAKPLSINLLLPQHKSASIKSLPASLPSLSDIHTDSPAVPPTAMAALICARSSGLGLRAPRVAATPPMTPIIPKALPRRAVVWLERPARAPTQHRPEPKYIIWREKETENETRI